MKNFINDCVLFQSDRASDKIIGVWSWLNILVFLYGVFRLIN